MEINKNIIENIDIVYTWVDSSDPYIYNQLNKYGDYRKDSSRVKNCNELMYSLRSIDKYMSWHKGRIFLVTYNQYPKWLNIKHPRINIISHEDIIPAKFIPTFNSTVIEAHLHNIPTLSEIFIYFNDDFFLNNYIQIDDFINIHQQTPIFVNHNIINVKPTNQIWLSTVYNAYNLINTNKKKMFFTHHAPYILNKSYLNNIYNTYKFDFFFNKFRKKNDVPPIYAHYAYAINLNKSSVFIQNNISAYFINVNDNITEKELINIFDHKNKFLCLNDAFNKDSTATLINKILNIYYPNKSQFELLNDINTEPIHIKEVKQINDEPNHIKEVKQINDEPNQKTKKGKMVYHFKKNMKIFKKFIISTINK